MRPAYHASRRAPRRQDRASESRDLQACKIYWIQGTDLIQTVGRLASVSTGAIFRHESRYLRAFVHGDRVFALLATPLRFEFLELGASDLAVLLSLYRGLERAPVDYDGRRFYFLSETEVFVYDTQTASSWTASYRDCR